MRLTPTNVGAVALAAIAGGSVRTARATTVTETFAFSATTFTTALNFNHAVPPYATVSGSFTLTFDPSRAVAADTTAGLTVNALSPPALGSSGVGYDYSPTFEGGDLTIGGLVTTVDGVSSGTDDFYIDISSLGTTAPNLDGVYYAKSSDTAYTWSAAARTLTVTATVPEPVQAGLWSAGVAAVVRRRRRGRASNCRA